jgi:glutaredoxin
MEYINPNKDFTVYSKSGCHYCTLVKRLLQSKSLNFFTVDCDEYILEDKDSFLNHIKSLINGNKEIKGFPIVFYNNEFIGGYIETKEFIKKIEAFEINDNF